MESDIMREELRLATQLNKQGIPLDPEVLKSMEADCAGLLIYQSGTIAENTVFDLDSGGAGFMLSVAIYKEAKRILYPVEYRLELPWPETQFRWLEDPWRKIPWEHAYSFPKPGPEGFEREVVLNHRCGRQGRILPGGCLEGLLLGVGQSPVPNHYENRQRIELPFAVLDQRGGRSELVVELCVGRRARHKVSDDKFNGRRRPQLAQR
jgi:hypothetical protein